jgi:hypothetical protein
VAVSNRRPVGRLTGLGPLWAALVAVCAACGGPSAPIGDDLYVEVMSRLSIIEARLLDSASTDSARAAVLREMGVSAEDLIEYSRVFGGDVEKMAELWERIPIIADSIEAAEAEELFDDTPGSGS